MEKKIAVFVGISENDSVVTGGERQLQEMIKGLKRNGFEVRFIKIESVKKNLKNITHGYERHNVYIINDYSRRFNLWKINWLCRMWYGYHVCTNVGNFYFDYRTSKIKNAIDYVVSYLYLLPSSLIFTTGNAVNERIIKWGKLKNRKMQAVYPALREELVQCAMIEDGNINEVTVSDTKNVLIVGRFHPVKGYDYLIDAMIFCKEEPFHFIIVGDYERNPNYYNHIMQRIEKENLTEMVTIYGRTHSDEELADLYNKAWCCLHTSVYDPSPMTICEPLLFGKPVIATDVGGIREYLTSEFDSIIVPEKNGKATAYAIKRLAENPEFYKRLSENTHLTLQKHIYRRWVDAGEEYYKGIMEIG